MTRLDGRRSLSVFGLVCSVHKPPDWRFTLIERSASRYPEYDSAWSLAEAMPLNTTAPVTARDHFVVGFTAEELSARMANESRDLSIPDDEIRQRYFHRTRSARYQSGDTRGWKLCQARRIVAADDRLGSKIIRCLYRPFDWRYVFWHPAMIDWPRNEVTRHLIDSEECKVRDQKAEVTIQANFAELRTLNPALLHSLPHRPPPAAPHAALHVFLDSPIASRSTASSAATIAAVNRCFRCTK